MDKLVNSKNLRHFAKLFKANIKDYVDNKITDDLSNLEEKHDNDIQSLSELINELDYENLLGFDTSEIVFKSKDSSTAAILDEAVLDKLILDDDGQEI